MVDQPNPPEDRPAHQPVSRRAAILVGVAVIVLAVVGALAWRALQPTVPHRVDQCQLPADQRSGGYFCYESP